MPPTFRPVLFFLLPLGIEQQNSRVDLLQSRAHYCDMSAEGQAELFTVAQAIAVLDAVEVRPRRVMAWLAQADGLVLATAVPTDRDYPPFDKSQMDGYAVRCADVASAPVDLQIVGESAAGRPCEHGIGPGQAVAIMTGAPIPAGADGVVPVEQTQKHAGGQTVRIVSLDGNPARFIARRGSDCRAGQMILTPGMRLGPAQIAAAASVGASRLEVFAAPRVAVLATGDELVPVDTSPGPSQIRNSNSPMLISLLRKLGCDVTDLGVAPDQPATIRQSLLRSLEYDALIVTGGMSMGEYDYVPALLKESGFDLKIAKLKIKPGKPFVFGVLSRSDGTKSFVFGLPGNPVSGFVCTVRLASRLITRLAGGTVEEQWLVGQLDSALPANGPREFYLPAIFHFPDSAGGGATFTPLGWKGSADVFTLAKANALIVRTENAPPLEVGSVVRGIEMG
jgi:molybdopterin molybdotransferase